MKQMMLSSVLGLSLLNVSVASELPNAFYASSIGDESFYTALKAEPFLKNIDKESYGAPIKVVVTYSTEQTAGGTASGLTSAILAGGSLGILPVVTNNDFVIKYEVRVQDTVLFTKEYRENFTEATNMYSEQGLYQIDGEVLTWALTTVKEFNTELSSDAKIQALVDEYQYYFSE